MTIKELRKKNKLTQKQCAEYLGVPLRTYQNYERDDADTGSIKYRYMFEKLETYVRVDEEHGILTIEEIKAACGRVFADYGVKYGYLFGSYAKGKATDNSDVDIFVSTELSGMKYYELVETLRESLNKKVDVLNQEQIKDNALLLDEILKDGIKIYG